MGLDMYLHKMSRIDENVKEVIKDKVLTKEDLKPFSENYCVYIEKEGIKPISKAIKDIGISFIYKDMAYSIKDVLKKYYPNYQEEDLSDWAENVIDGLHNFKIYLKGQEQPLVLNLEDEEYNSLLKYYENTAYIVKEEEVVYWRKANQIRAWFVKNLDEEVANCELTSVTKENIEALLKDCETVLKNKNKAAEIIPTSSGFFFGSSQYDEYYFEDIKETKKNLKQILKETDWENEAYCYTEWW